MSRAKLGGGGGRFGEGAKERRQGELGEPGRGGLGRIDVDGSITFEGARAIAVQVFGETFPVDGNGQVTMKNGAVYQLAKLDDRDCLVPV